MAVRRSFSLNDSDFYPLIHIHAKYMIYDEKVAYRAKHGIPDTIDKWIADGKTCTKAPTADPHRRGPSLESLFRQDVVECIFNVICKKVGIFDGSCPSIVELIIPQGLVKDGVQDPDEFTLTLRLRVPPTTSFLMYYWQSPTVVIDQYMGEFRDKFSPEWLKTVQTERRFWQSRTLMLEMMLNFVRDIALNSKVSIRVWSWCRAMSVSTSSELGK